MEVNKGENGIYRVNNMFENDIATLDWIEIPKCP
jgi:hypothetical protein